MTASVTTAFVGIDPDSARTPVAVYIPHREKVLVRMFRSEAGKRQMNIQGLAKTVADASLWAVDVCDAHGIGHGVLAVEGQEIYKHSKANPLSILTLATVAGYWAGGFMAGVSEDYWEVRMPRPGEWKGQVPKNVHHSRIASAFGWETVLASGYRIPVEDKSPGLEPVGKVFSGDWKHAMDAIGLAVWAAGGVRR